MGMKPQVGVEWVNPQDSTDVRTIQAVTTYDANGRPVQVVGLDGSVARTEYDAAGNLLLDADTSGQGVSYTYDIRGNRIEARYTDGTVERFSYDRGNRLAYQTDRFNPSAGVLPNGTHTTYDPVGRIVGLERLAAVQIDIRTVGSQKVSEFVSAAATLSTTSKAYDNAGWTSPRMVDTQLRV